MSRCEKCKVKSLELVDGARKGSEIEWSDHFQMLNSPSSHLGDGTFDVTLLERCSFIQHLLYLIRCSRNAYHLRSSRHVKPLRCTRLHIYPLNPQRTSTYNVDGECVDGRKSIELKILRKYISIFGTGIHIK
ncbi:hypothetical protein SNEBB_000957 [Seison nebaliae]|nr:hypothetical protein SNEBB_000957 [Seison nebaliae]